MSDVFERRALRAARLAKEWPFATEFLTFFEGVYRLQADIARDLAGRPDPRATPVGALFRFLPSLFDLVERQAPAPLKERTRELRLMDGAFWGRLVDLRHRRVPETAEAFLARTIVAPLAELTYAATDDSTEEADCPGCGSPPIVSLFREDKAAETVRRSLLCSFCSREWGFPRVVCPKCREEKPERLPRFTAQEIPWVRVEACDVCKTYLKAVDLTQCPDAEPIVDELASTPLDVIARDYGYEKLTSNLAGI